MSNQRIYKLTIVLVAVALLGLACGACSQTEEPTAPTAAQPIASPQETPVVEATPPDPPTEEATAEPPAETPPTEVPPAEASPPPPEPPTVEVVAPTPCPQVMCLPDCYANNLAPAGGDGTKGNPWRGTAADSQLFDDVECAAQERGIIPSSLTILTCSTNSQTCSGVLHTYDGQWTSTQLEASTPVPQPGVPLPLAIVLVGVAVLGIVLLGSGILLRIRARTLRS